jgi:hypothetical protein
VTGISAKVSLLNISKLPAISRDPKSMSRAMFRNSRLRLVDMMSIDGALSSLMFDSSLECYKNIKNSVNRNCYSVLIFWCVNSVIHIFLWWGCVN